MSLFYKISESLFGSHPNTPDLHNQILHDSQIGTYTVHKEAPNVEVITYNSPGNNLFNSHSIETYYKNINSAVPVMARGNGRKRTGSSRSNRNTKPAPPPKRDFKPRVRQSTRYKRPSAIEQSASVMRYTAPVAMGSSNLVNVQRSLPFVIRKSELFTSLYCYTDSAFERRTFTVNPGFNDMFPWLANLADSWEFYRFRSLAIRYNPTVGTNIPGMIMMAFDSDTYDAAPNSKQEFTQYTPNLVGTVWAPFGNSVPKREILHQRNNGKLLIRSTAVQGDANQYDVGKLYIAVQGCPVGALGDLYVDYEVELHVPQSNLDAFYWKGSFSSFNAATPFSTSVSVTGSSRISSTNNSIVFNIPGSFMMSYSFDCEDNTDTPGLTLTISDPNKIKITQLLTTQSAFATFAASYKVTVAYTDQVPATIAFSNSGGTLSNAIYSKLMITKIDPLAT